MEPFLLRALAAGLGLAAMAAPLGCFLVWQRMAFFGETVAQASLIGVALGLALQIDVTVTVLAASLAIALVLIALGRQKLVPVDTLLSLLAHSALAAGVLATALVKGRSVDLMGYLFGDILAVTREDLMWLALSGALVVVVLTRLWQPMLSLAVHEELAAAEGVDRDRVRAIFILLLAVVIAMAMKIVGVLLTVAFLIIPAAAARPMSSTPERMVMIAAVIGAAGVALGLALSLGADTPGGPSIVVVLALIALMSLVWAAGRQKKN
jgi:zinc transport system permease protein